MTGSMVCCRNLLVPLLFALAVPWIASGIAHAQASEPRGPLSVEQLQGWLRAMGTRTLFLGEHARHVAQRADLDIRP